MCVDNSEVWQVLIFKYCTKTKEIGNFTYPDFGEFTNIMPSITGALYFAGE